MAAYRRVDDLQSVTCGLTACTPGSAPGPTLGIEYGKPLSLLLQLTDNAIMSKHNRTVKMCMPNVAFVETSS